ncbi:MAG TPA: hypothetical protein VF120_05225, partial [Ktedonobacterales bacterium]
MAPASVAISPSRALVARIPRPLFGGYVFVASVAAWLAGLALAPVGPFQRMPPALWLVLAGVFGALWLIGRLATRRLARAFNPGWRLLLVVGVLGFWLALGAGRADTRTSNDTSSVARF